MTATKSQMAWNRGLTGQSGAPRLVARPGGCITEGCGELHALTEHTDLTRVFVEGSREPARVYCSSWCVTYGTALAEVRAIGAVA